MISLATSMFAYWKVDTTQLNVHCCPSRFSHFTTLSCAGTVKTFSTATGTVSINGDISQASGKRLDGSDGSGHSYLESPATVSSNMAHWEFPYFYGGVNGHIIPSGNLTGCY